jgi:hypothetical protein
MVIGLSHELSQFVSHAPSGLIGTTDLPFQFFGGNPMAGAGHEIQGKKPVCQFGTGPLKGRPDTRINMVAAMVAGESSPFAELMEFGNDLAVRTDKLGSAILDLHDLFEASPVVWEFGLEMLKAEIMQQPWPPRAKNGFGDPFARGKPHKASVLDAESPP